MHSQQFGAQFFRKVIVLFWLSISIVLVINLWLYANSYYSPVTKLTLQQWKLRHSKNSSYVGNSDEITEKDAPDKIRVVITSILKDDSTWERWLMEVSKHGEQSAPKEEDEKFQNDSKKCVLPNLEKWYSHQTKVSKPGQKHNCKKNKGELLFQTDRGSNLVINDNGNRKDCCYESISSPGTCLPITEKTTTIPAKQQNTIIRVLCKNSEFYNQKFALVQKYKKKIAPTLDTSYNVIVLGLQSVSLMGFMRDMPLSYNYLTKELSAISLKGHSKISDNAFANLIAFQTGAHPKEKVFDRCENFVNEYNRVDGYPFLFEKFSARGYYTSYSGDRYEKDVFLSHCHYKNLWEKSSQLPTDYFLVNLAKTAEADKIAQSICYGKENAFSIYLDHIEKMATTFKNDRYFQFTWQQMTSGADPVSLHLGDKILLNTLQFLKTSGYLNNTALILMSDQGVKTGKFRITEQGQLENRNPMAFFVLPSSFPGRFPLAMRNLVENGNKLTTPFDLHETIKNFMDLTRIEDHALTSRAWETKSRGVNLFLPLPEFRNCVSAGIPMHHCPCNPRVPYFEDNEWTMEAAYFMLRKLNDVLNNNPHCSPIRGSAIIAALRFNLDGKHHFNAYEYEGSLKKNLKLYRPDSKNIGLQITLRTRPCNVIFEASVIKLFDGDWLLSDEISITSDISSMVNVNNCTGIPENLVGYCCCNKNA